MKDLGSLKLIGLVLAVWVCLIGFYGFLAYRARLWSPLWVIVPTTQAFAETPRMIPRDPHSLSIERGRFLYRSLRCGVCHGPDGEGGVKNPNAEADPAEVVPNLYDLSESFTLADMKGKILKGAHTAKAEETGPEPPLDMPAWKEELPDADLEDLARYLFRLKSPAATEENKSLEPKGTGQEAR